MPKRAFQQAVHAAEHLRCQEGLRAIKQDEGGGQISAKDPKRLLGSASMDVDCKPKYPNDARWDYVIGYERSKKVIAYFVEVHSAETSGVSEIADKLAWLHEYLGRDAQAPLAKLGREIHWVASGRVNIPKHTPQFKRLSTSLRKLELRGPSKHLELA